MPIRSHLEAILFVSPKGLTAKELAQAIKEKPEEVAAAIKELSLEYEAQGRGIRIINNGSKYQMSTAPEESELARDFLKDEASGELSQPSLEALTIIAYRGPISKLDLERIRGVNCSLILRNLLIRGLIEEKFDKTKSETYYTVSLDFVRHLGLASLTQLPDYERLSRHDNIERVLEGTAGQEGKDE